MQRSGSGVCVAVRVRCSPDCTSCVSFGSPGSSDSTPCEQLTVWGNDKQVKLSCAFDYVFPQKCSQETVYETLCESVPSHVFDGYNACLLVYGQTASGKTYSMVAPDGATPQVMELWGKEASLPPSAGILPRVLWNLFIRQGTSTVGEVTTRVEVSSVELYNENFFDLLRDDTTAGAELRIREDRGMGGRGIFVEGVVVVEVRNVSEAVSLLVKASVRKHVASTNMNAASSRSHTITEVFVTQVDHVRHDTVTSSRLVLVDLAGSERVEKTGAVGDRLKEAQNINLSLSLLGNVIKKLTDGESVHIPYRDSKLTRLLQDSLGGNSLTTLLCTVSPEFAHVGETVSTIQFAQRAKAIRNKPVQNKVLGSVEMAKEVAYLRDELSNAQAKLLEIQMLSTRCTSASYPPEQTASLLAEIHELKQELLQSERDRESLREKVAFHVRQFEEEHRRAEGLELKLLQATERDVRGSGLVTRKMEIASSGSSTAKKQRFEMPLRAASIAYASASPEALGGLPPSPAPGVCVAITAHEQQLLSQVVSLQQELERLRKFPEMCDQLLRDTESLKEQHTKEMHALQSQLSAAKSQFASPAVDAKVHSELQHLQMENAELHAENRANAMRLLDFTKKIDVLSKEVNSLKDEKDKYLQALREANIDAEAKKRLLEMSQFRSSMEKSFFRKKLLDCFSST